MQTIEMTVSAQTQRRRRKRRSKFPRLFLTALAAFAAASFFGLLTFQQLAPGFPAEKLPSPSGPSFWSTSGTVSGPG